MSNEFMKSHHTFYCDPDENEQYKIVWKKIVPIEGDTDSTDIEFTPFNEYVGDGTNPAIAHSGNNVAIVYMSGANILCVYSSDDGENWDTVTIGPGSYPDICALGNTFQCAYVDGGDLYVISSSDGGANWGDPLQINDNDGSVVAAENSVDIHPAGIVWEDNRWGDIGVYYAEFGTPPSKPARPDGPTSGKINTLHEYSTYASDPGGDQIYYVFNWGDGTESEAGPYNSGDTGSASHKWTEEGNYEIKVKARDTAGFEGPWSDPLAVNMPRNKQVTYPLLQRLFELFPNAFPILRQILRL